MPALERLLGLHVVADPAALDAARWHSLPAPEAETDAPETTDAPEGTGTIEAPAASSAPGNVIVLRVAPDEAFAIDARRVDVADPDAIVVDECGFVGAWCSVADIGHHIEWPVPAAGPVLAQGAIAGVPAKLWIPGGPERVLLVAAAPYAHELSERLGWTR